MVCIPRIDSFGIKLSGQTAVRILMIFAAVILVFISGQKPLFAAPLKIHLCYEKNITQNPLKMLV